MVTFLDAIVLIFMVLTALSLLALCLMFLVRKPMVRKVCFYMVVVLGIYAATVGVRIGQIYFPVQTTVAILAGIGSIAAFVLERLSKQNEKKFFIARILAAVALVVGICNAFFF